MLQTQKAEAANKKAAAENAKKAAAEDLEWSQGAKSNAKKFLSLSLPSSTANPLPLNREEATQKKLELARKKAESQALLAAEEATQRSTPKNANAKTAPKKTRGLDLSQLDSPSSSSTPASTLNATGIDNALDALSLTTSSSAQDKVERHPERRFKAAYAAFEARRLPELEAEQKGLRRQQRLDIVRKEFEKSEENPFNQVRARFDSTKEEIRAIREEEREKIEDRLAG